MAFDNARILNCYKLRAFLLLSMSGCFHGLRLQLVDFDPFWFLFPIHKVGVLRCRCIQKQTKRN